MRNGFHPSTVWVIELSHHSHPPMYRERGPHLRGADLFLCNHSCHDSFPLGSPVLLVRGGSSGLERTPPPVVPFCHFLGEGSPAKVDKSKNETTGTLILTSLLEDLVYVYQSGVNIIQAALAICTDIAFRCPREPWDFFASHRKSLGSMRTWVIVLNPRNPKDVAFLRCSWHVFWFFSFLVLFIFTGGLQKTFFLLPYQE